MKMKVAVVFWSSTGNTESMAEAIVEGAKGAGAEVELKNIPDFSADDVANYDVLAFGCPAMGDEVLEEDEVQPWFDGIKGALSGKKLALFGSYGWGDGEWMRNWEEDCKAAGAELIAESLTCQEEPDDDGVASCKAFGAALNS